MKSRRIGPKYNAHVSLTNGACAPVKPRATLHARYSVPARNERGVNGPITTHDTLWRLGCRHTMALRHRLDNMLRIFNELHERAAGLDQFARPLGIAGISRDDLIIEEAPMFPNWHEPSVRPFQKISKALEALGVGVQHPSTIPAVMRGFAESLPLIFPHPQHLCSSHHGVSCGSKYRAHRGRPGARVGARNMLDVRNMRVLTPLS